MKKQLNNYLSTYIYTFKEDLFEEYKHNQVPQRLLYTTKWEQHMMASAYTQERWYQSTDITVGRKPIMLIDSAK